MKKRIICIATVLLTVILSSCFLFQDRVLSSLGKYESHEFYTSGGFQDYTDYAKYYFSKANITDNNYFSQIQSTDLDTLNEHLDDFEGWIGLYKQDYPEMEIAIYYDFDRSLIDTEDYFCLGSEKVTFENGITSLVNYDIYFFDIQTNVLYYFHNNI